MNSHPILYSFRRCPYAIRARMGLAAAQVAVELREILLKDKPAEMLAASVKGTVPVLVMSDGQVMDESRDILIWALQKNDPFRWLPESLPESLRLIRQNDEQFKPLLDRYKYHVGHPERSQSEYREEACELLAEWDARLSASGMGLCGDRLDIADVAIFPFVRQFSGVEPQWWDQKPLPHLANWLERWLEDEVFRRVMTKWPVWNPGTSGPVLDWS